MPSGDCGSKKWWILVFACLLLGFEGIPLLILIAMFCIPVESNRIGAYEVEESAATAVVIDTQVIVQPRQNNGFPPAPSAPSPREAVPDTNQSGTRVPVARLAAALLSARIERQHLLRSVRTE